MALQKQNININFTHGVDTKTDPFQVQADRFLALKNIVRKKGGRLDKRNGYGTLPALPDASSTFITTFNGNLTAIGTSLHALSGGSLSWVTKGAITPVEIDVLPMIRNNTNQSQCDAVMAANGLVCVVYEDQNPASLGASIYKYAIVDGTTGQNVVAPTQISDADPTYGNPRVFLLGTYFVIVYTNLVSALYHLKYIAISTATLAANASVDISTSYTPASTVAFDAVVLNNTLFVAWNGASASGMKMATLTATLSLSSAVTVDGSHVATMVSVCADVTNAIVYVSYYNLGTTAGYVLAVDSQLLSILAATAIITTGTILNITGTASAGVATLMWEISNAYSYDSAVKSNYVVKRTVTQGGSLGTVTTVARSVGLASKSFVVSGTIYVLSAFSSPYQPTYFLLDSSGNIIAKLAYTNGGGYLTNGLPSVTVSDTSFSVPYLFKDLVQSVNKNTNVPSGTQTAGIYSQTGVNIAYFTLFGEILAAEIGQNLNLSGGYLSAYDGNAITEQGFHLFPDSVEATWSATGGAIVAKPDGSTNTNAYFYQAVYEWTDNQGNAFRSAPSVPIAVTTTGAGSAGSITVNVPTLRLTSKTSNPVKIVIYRWSVAQQIYYQVTSITVPTLNSTSSDSIAFLDTLADASILGNNIIYTNGGVVENTGGPACKSVFIFDDRLWAIDSEDQNLLWYSKQALQAAPIELSDLFTMYVAPNTSSQGPSGVLNCGSPMDDKAILFKDAAILYFNGTGPDNTGANSQYSPPTLITATVGCSNQKSIVFQPNGLMFEFASESGNGIWILGRDLSTRYIGAPVEDFTLSASVESAVNIPGTNQVRFTLSSGVTLMYDYYYNEWSTFYGVPAISSCLYQGLHTYINSFGRVYQETPNLYVDGSSPVLIGLTTAWINLAGLQGYQRAYYFFLLATYLSPHKLAVSIAYDYQPFPSQSYIITPDNFSGTYGDDSPYGDGSPYGGPSPIEQWRNFFAQQKCEAFQITITEIFDPSHATAPGAGFTLSGLNLVVGLKKGWPRIAPSKQTG